MVHDSGRGAPLSKVEFRNPYKYKKDKEYFISVEGKLIKSNLKWYTTNSDYLKMNEIS